MPRKRHRRKKIVHPHFKNFLDLLGSTEEVDRFIVFLRTYPRYALYVAYIEEDQVIMEHYTKRMAKYQGVEYVAWQKSKLRPGQSAHPVV